MAGIGLQEDKAGKKVQGFAARKIVTITADAAWTPEERDLAFRVGVSCAYYNSTDGSGHEASLLAGAITVIDGAITSFTFDTTFEMEVM